ncbi:hypothetical protein IQ244_27690 [Nostoc sp. LEGE 06077]|uniref:hypothetical protein n=1 Tax=Nostoc sp. LEGE 06077 TaxID=915325 RepID=UPI00187EF79B|nr:hypothetical protein [Nostoc sp. LEGE 06077]MBE9210212.1 hypothetical protein [Nostoc sp. LEGE 06077]
MAVITCKRANFLFYLTDVNHNSGTFYREKRLENMTSLAPERINYKISSDRSDKKTAIQIYKLALCQDLFTNFSGNFPENPGKLGNV